MLNINDKIYYIDYEESGSIYTIIAIDEVKDHPYLPDGIYYHIHSDNLSPETGYYVIPSYLIDSTYRFFSSVEKAREAYKVFKEKYTVGG